MSYNLVSAAAGWFRTTGRGLQSGPSVTPPVRPSCRGCTAHRVRTEEKTEMDERERERDNYALIRSRSRIQ